MHMAIRSALLSIAAVLALTGQAPEITPGLEAQAFQAIVHQGLTAAPQDFASIRVTTNSGNRYVPIYDATVAADATYVKPCSIVDETDSSSFQYPSWSFECTIAMPGDSSDARLAQIVAEVVSAVPDGFARTDRNFSGGRLVYWAGPDNTYVVIQKGPGLGFSLSVRHGPGSVDY